MAGKKKYYLDLDLKFQLGNMVVNVLCISYEPPTPSWSYSNHAHSSYELHFIPSGYGLLRVGQRQYTIEPGTFYLTGPGLYHQQEADREYPMTEYCLNIELKHTRKRSRGTDFFLYSETDEIASVFQNTNFWFGHDEYSLSNLCISAMDEIDNRSLGCYTFVQNLVSQLIVRTARIMTEKKKSHAEMTLPTKITDDRRRFLADHFFQLNLSSDPKVLAAKLGISMRQLNRIMQEYYSMTFKEKLLDQRIEYAKSMLLSTELSIKKIVEDTGYANIGYFYKIFKKATGETPNGFRQRYSTQHSRGKGQY